MASETQETQTNDAQAQPSEGLLIGLSMIGGLGITLIVVALGIGVVLPTVDSGVIGLAVMAGFGLLALGIGGWTLVVQPYRNFDDINEPMYHGHHHDDDHGHDDESDTIDNG